MTSWHIRQPKIKLANGVEVEKVKILGYFNDYFFSAMDIYNKYKRFGLPWGDKYMETPEYLIIIYELFDSIIDQSRDPKVAKARAKYGSR